jgi:hypothetical protein
MPPTPSTRINANKDFVGLVGVAGLVGLVGLQLRFRLRNVQQKLSCALSFQSLEPENLSVARAYSISIDILNRVSCRPLSRSRKLMRESTP